MRAVVCKELIGPGGLVVEDIPAPEPGPGEVRIRVRAAGLNFADSLIIRGQYQEKPALPCAGHGDRRPHRCLRPFSASRRGRGSWRR